MTTGTFRPGDNKVRPGSYFYFKSQNPGTPNLSEKGIVFMPLALDWGEAGQVVTISQEDGDNLYPELGYKINDLLPLREAFKAANKVIVYPINKGGTKAKITFDVLVVEALKAGALGNNIKVKLAKAPDNTYILEGTLGKDIIFRYEDITKYSQLPAKNSWVSIKSTAEEIDAEQVGTYSLAGGTSGTSDNEAITECLDALENYEFNTIPFTFTDTALKTSFVTKIKYLRENIGLRVQGVIADYAGADYEGITSVENGVVLSDGTVLDKNKAVYWVAAASAAAGATGDLTYIPYPDAVECSPILKHSEVEQGLKAGKFMFTKNDGAIRVEEDINTLKTFIPDKDESYTDNRVVRTFDDFMKSASRILIPNKYPNNEDGMDLVKKDLVNLLLEMEKAGSIKNVDIENDIIIDKIFLSSLPVKKELSLKDQLDPITLEILTIAYL